MARLFNSLHLFLQEDKELATRPVHVQDIRIKGLKNTNERVLKREFENVLKAKTFGELSDKINESLVSSASLDVFSKVDVTLDADDNGVVLNLDVTEKAPSKWSIGAYTTPAKKESELSVECGRRNLLGFADFWSLRAKVINFKSLRAGVGANFPHILPRRGDLFFDSHIYGIRTFKVFKESSHGFTIGTRFGKHFFSYELMARNLNLKEDKKEDGKNLLSFVIHHLNDSLIHFFRQVQQQSLKSAITHSFTIDKRTDIFKGLLFKATNSIAGLGPLNGDVKFISSEFKTDFYVPLIKSLVLGLHLSGGILYPLNNPKFVSLNDRFFESVRGFKKIGVIDPATNEELGGNVRTNAMAHLIWPMQFNAFTEAIGLHGHAWVNAGTVENHFLSEGNTREYTNAREFAKSFIRDLYASAGIGLLLLFGGAFKVELNYCHPIQMGRISSPDNIQKFGFKIEPMD